MDLPFLKTDSISEMLDKFSIKELIEYERYCRDHALWPQMRECYAQDSRVDISWFQGSGWDFVEASSKMELHAPHRLENTLVWLNGDRAFAVTMAVIAPRKIINGREYDMASHARLLYRAQRSGACWKLMSLETIYERDALVPVTPEELSLVPGARPSYSVLTTVLGGEGYAINGELAGDDRPELAAGKLSDAAAWLHQA